jgi:CheY-like chemotaxis protein
MLRILHIEDNPDTRDIVKHVLRGEMEVHGVGSLAAAHELLAASGITFDVVLTDLGLPDATGTEVITALQPYNLPIVVLSANADDSTLQRAAALGAADYVGVLTRDALLKRVRFVHARATKQKASGSRSPFGRQRMAAARFEQLKPFIACCAFPS